MEKIVAAGAVITRDGKLLVSHDGKDDFYKIPGGKVQEKESLEECVKRELKEETGLNCEVLEKLSTQHLIKKPGTEEKKDIYLYHFKSELIEEIKNYDSFKYNNHEVRWVSLDNLENYNVSPNILFLKNKGEI
jgi:ADP-ribose pyrophosphatase YjhB (NUDIX family)